MPQYGLEYGRVCRPLRTAAVHGSDAGAEGAAADQFRAGGNRSGRDDSVRASWMEQDGEGMAAGESCPSSSSDDLLGDDQLANINRFFPAASFGEDEQTAYGTSWTGANVVFAGHSGIDAATGVGRNVGRGEAWGPYEQMPPPQWQGGQITSESYRRCCTSVGWVAEALALRLMHAEASWNHDAFFDYVDRWMGQDDSESVREIKSATTRDFSPSWARQGQSWDDFANEMWAKHRARLKPPTDGWQKPHDDSYYRNAIDSEHKAKPSAAPGK